MPHKKLAQIWLSGETPERAIPHLEQLDRREEKSPVYAVKLAELYRSTGQLELAQDKAIRALHINPYDAPNRELTAAIAIERGRMDLARQHIEALTLIEPDRQHHRQRLEAVERMLGGEGTEARRHEGTK
jgi:tetratricopeptide (TPR) repeat protein